jgi:hypothetical protein
MKKQLYRILETYGNDGPHEYWRGAAFDPDEALERAYDDETSGGFVTLTIERWGTVKFSSAIKGKGWVHEWTGRLAAD